MEESRLLGVGDNSSEEFVVENIAEERCEKSDADETERRILLFCPMAGLGEAVGEGDSIRTIGCSESIFFVYLCFPSFT